jgi:predicted enzyme related to lactoylglutathione lyase
MATGVRKAGEFCWINVLTPQPDKACEFFGKLLGWTYGDLPGGGQLAQVGGRNIGAVVDLAASKTPKGTTAHIGLMVKVDSADAMAAKVQKLGGKAMAPLDVMDKGRMVVCFDPNGAEFDLWEPKGGRGMDADSSQHGAPSWFETLTTNVDRVAGFYTDLFGWTAEIVPKPGFQYTVFKLGEVPIAGTMQILPYMGKMSPHWATYFTVKDTDQTAQEATKLGAKICVPPQDIPDIGRFCGITSPQGVTFYVIKYTR